MRILVTGGAGFIGSHLVTWLVRQGYRVRVLDNLSTGRKELLDPIRSDVELFVADLRDAEAVSAVAQGTDIIFHLAAMVSVVQSVESPLDAYAVNATGTLHLLEAARLAGVRRVVQASTCAVYADNDHLPLRETELPRPLSPYAATKLAAEQAGQLYTRLYDVETVALRFFNVYGPYQDPASPYAAAIPRFITTLRKGNQPTIYGDGLQSRDFVFVGDVVRALWTAATVPGVAGDIFNVGRGEAYTVVELVQTIGELLNLPVSPHFAPPRSGEVRHSRADTTHFAERARFQAAIGLREGLAATIWKIT
jgi:nucleoside-diphosphate-sugar epimerase